MCLLKRTVYSRLSIISEDDDDEIQAQNLTKNGDIEQAIAIYKQLKPESARIFIIIGALYAENLGNYDLAIEYYEKALNIQEMVILIIFDYIICFLFCLGR